MMTEHTAAALATALAYHDAWTGNDIDRAMAHVTDRIVCQAPGRAVTGAAAYRQFLAGFARQLTGVEMIAAFDDGDTAVLMYYARTASVTDAATAEYFTVAAGKITRTVLVFDRPSFAPPGQ